MAFQVNSTITGVGAEFVNLSEILVADDTSATGTIPPSSSITLTGHTLGFSIPAGATINGIEVSLRHYSGAYPDISITDCYLWHPTDGTSTDLETGSFVLPDPGLPPEFSSKTYGSSTELWGKTWTSSNINHNDFKANVVYTSATGAISVPVEVDQMSVTVHYTVAATAANKFLPLLGVG